MWLGVGGHPATNWASGKCFMSTFSSSAVIDPRSSQKQILLFLSLVPKFMIYRLEGFHNLVLWSVASAAALSPWDDGLLFCNGKP